MSNSTKQKIKEGLVLTGTVCGALFIWVWKTAEKKGANEQKNRDTYETINMLREAGHDDEEVIQIIQKKWDLTPSEAKMLLKDSSFYNKEVDEL